MYSASFTAQAETAAVDLFDITSSSGDVVVIHEIGLSQISDAGDANEELLRLVFKRGVTIGSGGAAVTEVPFLPGDSATGTTVNASVSTQHTGGSVLYNWVWNNRVGFVHTFTPETRPILAPSTAAVFELDTAPAASTTFDGYVIFEEIG
jgi:hypothetical protein